VGFAAKTEMDEVEMRPLMSKADIAKKPPRMPASDPLSISAFSTSHHPPSQR
jgi:hypothetical protein